MLPGIERVLELQIHSRLSFWIITLAPMTLFEIENKGICERERNEKGKKVGRHAGKKCMNILRGEIRCFSMNLYRDWAGLKVEK